MKFKEYLNEKKIPSELKTMVKNYQSARKTGNVKLAKQIKVNIDKEIKKLKLNTKEVYGKDRRSFDYGLVIPDRRKGK